MEFKIGKSNSTKVIYAFENCDLCGLSETLKAYVNENKLFKGKRGEIFTNLGPNSENLILVGLGKKDEISLENIRRSFLKLGKTLKANNVSSCDIKINKFEGICYKLTAQAIMEGIINSTYSFDKFLKEKNDKYSCEIFLEVEEDKKEKISDGIKEIKVLTEAVFMCRDLVNRPANDIYPETLANFAKDELEKVGVNVEILEKKQIEALKMEAFLAVSRGSDLPPKFIIMKYLPNKDEKPIVLVGKGLTYDAGGLAIKPATGMVDMKTDMGGSAAVISTMYAIGKMNIQRNVIALVASCENMINGSAYRNGDIISSMKGSTIEVINTDAEGRLTLADALYYGASKLNPECIIDVATLTGACIYALGGKVVGAVSNNDEIFEKVKNSADIMGEYLWRFPVFEEHRESVKGKIADLLNSTGPGSGGAITAGIFLEHFVENTPWVHLDIAGPSHSATAWGINPQGASGIPVKTLYNFVKKFNK
ncbi:MAG: leucyl aminopeptidase [Parvimonas sp.]|uniref:leucyl aminopeptidase n=1 Tax=Parvimonas sp. TaxID=1944660 RepID=UPI0025D6B815|nr:leucyl aminopeptidase [Parvimonas sp.]MCI5997538.1 leucyl aminopeptidase [Parvimonas sp.]